MSYQSFFTCSSTCPHGQKELFQKEYKRSNRTKGLKILRCFPHCCPQHIERSYCGSSLQLLIDRRPPSQSSHDDDDDEFVVYARFELAATTDNESSSSLQIGQELSMDFFHDGNIQTEEFPEGIWIPGSKIVDSNNNKDLVFALNGKMYPRWYYDWESGANKAQRFAKHVFKAYIFKCLTKNTIQLVDIATSSEFTFISYRRSGEQQQQQQRTPSMKKEIVKKKQEQQLHHHQVQEDIHEITSGQLMTSSDDYHSSSFATFTSVLLLQPATIANDGLPQQQDDHHSSSMLLSLEEKQRIHQKLVKRRRLLTREESNEKQHYSICSLNRRISPSRISLSTQRQEQQQNDVFFLHKKDEEHHSFQPSIVVHRKKLKCPFPIGEGHSRRHKLKMEERILWEHAHPEAIQIGKSLAIFFSFLQYTPMSSCILKEDTFSTSIQEDKKKDKDILKQANTTKLFVFLKEIIFPLVKWFFSINIFEKICTFFEQNDICTQKISNPNDLRLFYATLLKQIQHDINKQLVVLTTSTITNKNKNKNWTLDVLIDAIIGFIYQNDAFYGDLRPLVRDLLSQTSFCGFERFIAQYSQVLIEQSRLKTTRMLFDQSKSKWCLERLRLVKSRIVHLSQDNKKDMDIFEWMTINQNWNIFDFFCVNFFLTQEEISIQLDEKQKKLQVSTTTTTFCCLTTSNNNHNKKEMLLILDGQTRLIRTFPNGLSTLVLQEYVFEYDGIFDPMSNCVLLKIVIRHFTKISRLNVKLSLTPHSSLRMEGQFVFFPKPIKKHHQSSQCNFELIFVN